MGKKHTFASSHHKLELDKLLAFTLHNYGTADIRIPLQIDFYNNQFQKDYLFEAYFSGAVLRLMGRTDPFIGLSFNIYAEYNFGANQVSQLVFNNDRGRIHAFNHRDLMPYFIPLASLGYCLSPAPRFSQKWDLEKLIKPIMMALDNRTMITDNSDEPMNVAWLEQSVPLRRRYSLSTNSRYGKAVSTSDQKLVQEPTFA